MSVIIPKEFDAETEERLMKQTDYRTVIPKQDPNKPESVLGRDTTGFLTRFIAKRAIYRPEENVYCHPVPQGKNNPQNILVWCSFGPAELGTFDFDMPLSSKGAIPIKGHDKKGSLAFWPLGMFCSKKEAWNWVNNSLKVKNPNAVFWNIRVEKVKGPTNIIPDDSSYTKVEWHEEYQKIMKTNSNKVLDNSSRLQQRKQAIKDNLKKKEAVQTELVSKYDALLLMDKDERQKHENEYLEKLLSKPIDYDVVSKEVHPKGDIRTIPPSCIDLFCQMERMSSDPMVPFKWILIKKADGTILLAKEFI
jgi:hypothetical protein